MELRNFAFVGYDGFVTIRFRYADGFTDEIALLEGTDDHWWKGDWESYLFNMMESITKSGSIKSDWETAMVVITDWNDKGFELHTFHMTQGNWNFDHDIRTINE